MQYILTEEEYKELNGGTLQENDENQKIIDEMRGDIHKFLSNSKIQVYKTMPFGVEEISIAINVVDAPDFLIAWLQIKGDLK